MELSNDVLALMAESVFMGFVVGVIIGGIIVFHMRGVK